MPAHPRPDTERPAERDSGWQAALLDHRFDVTPERLAALIDTRRDLLDGLEQHPEWAEQEAEVSALLKSILTSGCLRFVRIDVHTPASVLDQIVKYEAVHRIRDSRDLERRLAEDRRCYAFFHPALPDDPLIFTEVALTHGMSSNAQALLDPESPVIDPSTCDSAVFYSITSCHEGLRGIPLGKELIGQVADELARVFPGLGTFATLSPVPGFRSWLANLARSRGDGAARALAAATLTSLERSDWHADADTSAELERQLVPLCAYYLRHARRGDDPADPVARFHLRNGARLERINWLSDTSVAGMGRAAGLMVNYVYRCHDRRREFHASAGARAEHASRQVERLAEQGSVLFRH